MHKIYRFNEDREGFGKKLKELMVNNGYTIESLADEMLISENTIKKWRSGERVPDIDTIQKLASMFETTMHQLYMPNSIYSNSFSEELISMLNKRNTIDDVSVECAKEVLLYSEYLFQKLLFSFLSFKEKGHLEVLFDCFVLTKYGEDKLSIEAPYSFDVFYFKTKEYIIREYGKSLPFKIDYKLSESIYEDFEKMIDFKKKGVM